MQVQLLASTRSRIYDFFFFCHFMESLRLEKPSKTSLPRESKLCPIPTLSPAQSTECNLPAFLGHLQVWGLYCCLLGNNMVHAFTPPESGAREILIIIRTSCKVFMFESVF